MAEKVGPSLSSELDEEISLDELRDFANGDLTGLPVDLEFKRRLRDRLWEILSQRKP
jgi:hypothetical protein